MNIAEDIKAKSDQLNAADLMGGPIVVQIERVERGNREQPVVVHISGGHQPWKPSKTALRALAHFWGLQTEAWAGRWVRLYRDPRALWAGKPVGGIMPDAMSHIERAETLTLPYARSKTNDHAVARLDPPQSAPPTLDAIIDPAGITRAQVAAWLASKNRPALTAETEAKLAGWLAADPSRLEQVRS